MIKEKFTEEFKDEAVKQDVECNHQILGPIGNIPPAEYELMYSRQLEVSSAAG